MLRLSVICGVVCLLVAHAAPIAEDTVEPHLGADYTDMDPGVPVTGSVGSMKSKYYRLALPGGKTNPTYDHVDITMTSTSGDADLYVTLDQKNSDPPGPTNAQYASLLGGTDYVTVRRQDWPYERYCKDKEICVIRIAVAGWFLSENSEFILVATPSNNVTELTPGVPHYDHASEGKSDFFSVSVPKPGKHQESPIVTVTVTPFTGDPDLFESATEHHPRQGHSDRAVRTLGQEVMVITEGSKGWCDPPCDLYLGVYADGSNTTFTITATVDADATQTLIVGQSQDGYVAGGSLNEFVFSVPGGEAGSNGVPDTVTITLTSNLGDADLYVTLDGKAAGTGHYQRKSEHSGHLDQIIIQSDDAQWNQYCSTKGTPCTIHVGVEGFHGGAFFSLLASTSSSNTQLRENVPLQGSVGDGQYAYYVLTLPSGPPNDELLFQLTVTSGDADMVVINSNSSVTKPTFATGQYYWAALDIGTDAVEIFPEDPHAKVCGTPCTYYVGVYGVSNSTFSLLARERDSDPTQLVPGIPQSDGVNVSLPNYYYAMFPESATGMTISVSPSSGDPDVYVQLGGDARSTRPTRSSADYISDAAHGDDMVVIRRNSVTVDSKCKKEFKNDGQCVVSIAVNGEATGGAKTARYIIIASFTNGTIDLPENRAVSATVLAHKYVYFRYRMITPYAITIGVTPLDGDPDLYVSVDTPTPSKKDHTWQALGGGHETLTIPEDDPDVMRKVNENGGYPVDVYIAVFGWFWNASFRILAGQGLFLLGKGYPIDGHAEEDNLAYFWMVTPDREQISSILSITPIRGTSTIYLGNDWNANGRPVLPHYECNEHGDDCHVTHTFTDSKGSNRLQFGPGDDHFHMQSPYVVAILCTDSPIHIGCDFTLTYSESDDIQTLQSGVPVSGQVASGTYNYYRLITNQRGDDVVVTLSTSVGDSDLYASVDPSNPKPDSLHYNYSALSLFEDVLTIPWAAIEQFCPDSTSLSAADMERLGRPRSSSKGPLPPLLPQLQPISSTATSSDSPTISIDGSASPLGDDPPPGSCEVFISVKGFRDSTYTIVAVADSTDPIDLVDGQPQAGIVEKGKYQYYNALVDAEDGTTWIVAVDSTSGDADVMVLLNGKKPSLPNNFDYHSSNYGGVDLLQIPKAPTGSNGIAGIAVYGYERAEYTITYSTSDIVTQLRNGVSQSSSVAKDKYLYFSFDIPGSPPKAPVVFRATSYSGDVSLYASVRTSADTRPTKGASQWESVGLGQDTITITKGPSHCPQPAFGCAYIVGVRGEEGSSDLVDFSITATFGEDSLVRLVDGASVQSSIAYNEYQYYYFRSTELHTNLTFALSTTRGAVSMYISNSYIPGQGGTGLLPNHEEPQSYNWSSVDPNHIGGPDTIVVLFGDKHRSPQLLGYTIGVRGLTASEGQAQYAIVASSSEMAEQLALGVPSAQRAIAQNENQKWFVDVTDTSLPLTLSISALAGKFTLGIARENPFIECTPNHIVSKPPKCVNETWSTAASGDSLIRIDPNNPCANGDSHCSASHDWKPGRFYVNVFSSSVGSYSLTAATSSSQTLRPGRPALVLVSNSHPAFLQLLVSPDPTKDNADVRFVFQRTNADGSPVSSGPSVAISLDSCSGDSCTTHNKQPTPSTAKRATVLAASAADILVSPSQKDKLWCDAASDVCGYFVGVQCATSGCEVHMQVTATVQDASSSTAIPFSSVSSNVATSQGIANVKDLSRYEVYLGDEATDVRLNIAACTNNYAVLYVCDPTATKKCSDPFNPTPKDYSYKVETNAGKSYASVSISAETAGEVYASVGSGSSSSSSGTFGYEFSASAGKTFYLAAPSDASLQVVKSSGTAVELEWNPFIIVDDKGKKVATAGKANYVVFGAPNGFSGNAVTTTACGVSAWASKTSDGTISVVGTSTHVSIPGLDAKQEYDFTVVASCDNECFSDAASSLFTDNKKGHILKAYSTQSVALGKTATATTGNAPGPSPSQSHGIPPGGVAAIIIVLGLGVVGVGGWVWYRRRKGEEAEAQYQSFDDSNPIEDGGDAGFAFFGTELPRGSGEGGEYYIMDD